MLMQTDTYFLPYQWIFIKSQPLLCGHLLSTVCCNKPFLFEGKKILQLTARQCFQRYHTPITEVEVCLDVEYLFRGLLAFRNKWYKFPASRAFFPACLLPCVSLLCGTHLRHLACLRLHVLRAYCNFKSFKRSDLENFVWAMPK